MADTMYAWSPIRYSAEKDDNGNILSVKTLAVGETVTASKLGVDKENFQALVEAGSVRPYAPPKMPDTFQGSQVEFLRSQAEVAEISFATGVGGSYFGPNEEEVLLDPESALTAEGTSDKDDPAALAEDEAKTT